MADLLKKYLASAGIEYMERVFSSSEGIRGLGDDPFVSGHLVYTTTLVNINQVAIGLCYILEEK